VGGAGQVVQVEQGGPQGGRQLADLAAGKPTYKQGNHGQEGGGRHRNDVIGRIVET
jgi:hypothetical protein